VSAITSIVIGVAAKVGAPIVKGILEKQLGGTAGEIGGTIIDAIAAQAGVTPDQIPSLPPADIEEAVIEVEQRTPELILAQVEQQKEANRLMLAEMNKDTAFGWMWRPAGMWLMLLCIAWFVMLRPLLNALLWSMGTGVQIEVGLDVATFLGIFTIYTGLYMGGNTVIRAVQKNSA
jgi:Holin of 3TMs, for gene-transfer release